MAEIFLDTKHIVTEKFLDKNLFHILAEKVLDTNRDFTEKVLGNNVFSTEEDLGNIFFVDEILLGNNNWLTVQLQLQKQPRWRLSSIAGQ